MTRALLTSFNYAFSGLAYTLRTQRNAKIHVFVACVTLALGATLNLSLNDWRWLIFAIGLVLFAETMNTAFEFLCDVVSPQFLSSVKNAKDIAAGAVLITATSSFCIGLMTLIPYIFPT